MNDLFAASFLMILTLSIGVNCSDAHQTAQVIP